MVQELQKIITSDHTGRNNIHEHCHGALLPLQVTLFSSRLLLPLRDSSELSCGNEQTEKKCCAWSRAEQQKARWHNTY
jgi:hypothetical protein